MYTKNLKVYDIQQFHYARNKGDFYVNKASDHLRKFQFVQEPHKHDHFLTMVFTGGTGIHEIDFVKYPIASGSTFLISPGQTHSLKVSENADGFVLMHTKDFYEINYSHKKVRDFPFFCSNLNSPVIQIGDCDVSKIAMIFEELIKENETEAILRNQVLCSLTDMLYIYLTRLYIPQKTIGNKNRTYLVQLLKLEEAIEHHFKEIKSPAAYASMLNMTMKHLNRVCNICVGKTTSDLILDRILLEAKRLLADGTYSIEKVACTLGYFDQSHFTRLFKKSVGLTPLEFMKSYRGNLSPAEVA